MKLSELISQLYQESDFSSVGDLAEAVSERIGKPVSRQTVENIMKAQREYMEVLDGLWEVLEGSRKSS